MSTAKCPTCDGRGYVFWWPVDDYRYPHSAPWSEYPADRADVCPECDRAAIQAVRDTTTGA